MDYRDWGRGDLARHERRSTDSWSDDSHDSILGLTSPPPPPEEEPRPVGRYRHDETGVGQDGADPYGEVDDDGLVPSGPYAPTSPAFRSPSRRRGADRDEADRYIPDWAGGTEGGLWSQGGGASVPPPRSPQREATGAGTASGRAAIAEPTAEVRAIRSGRHREPDESREVAAYPTAAYPAAELTTRQRGRGSDGQPSTPSGGGRRRRADDEEAETDSVSGRAVVRIPTGEADVPPRPTRRGRRRAADGEPDSGANGRPGRFIDSKSWDTSVEQPLADSDEIAQWIRSPDPDRRRGGPDDVDRWWDRPTDPEEWARPAREWLGRGGADQERPTRTRPGREASTRERPIRETSAWEGPDRERSTRERSDRERSDRERSTRERSDRPGVTPKARHGESTGHVTDVEHVERARDREVVSRGLESRWESETSTFFRDPDLFGDRGRDPIRDADPIRDPGGRDRGHPTERDPVRDQDFSRGRASRQGRDTAAPSTDRAGDRNRDVARRAIDPDAGRWERDTGTTFQDRDRESARWRSDPEGVSRDARTDRRHRGSGTGTGTVYGGAGHDDAGQREGGTLYGVRERGSHEPPRGRGPEAATEGRWAATSGQWSRPTETRGWDRYTDTGQWDRFTDTTEWDRSELARIDPEALKDPEASGDRYWPDREETFWSGTRLAGDDPRWMDTPTSAPRSPAVAYPFPEPDRERPDAAPRGVRPDAAARGPRPGTAVSSGAAARTGAPGRSGTPIRTGASGRSGTATWAARPASSARGFGPAAVSANRRLQDDLLDPNPGGPFLAVLYAAAWYAVPVLVFLVWLLTLDNSVPAGCVTDVTGGGCDSERARAMEVVVAAAPRFGTAFASSLVCAVLLRWWGNTWRAGSVGLAAAVVGGGVSTVLVSVVSGQPIGG